MIPQFSYILLVDDHPIFRDGLRFIVQQQFPSAQIHEADSVEAMEDVMSSYGVPDLFLLDLVFPGFDADRSVHALRTNHPSSSIVVISMLEEQDTIQAIMAAGANGYISKAVPPVKLIEGLGKIADGELVVLLSNRVGESERLIAKVDGPSPRQLDVLKLITKGYTNREIATALEISYFTVRVHVSNMLRQWEVPSRTSLATYALKQGWITNS